VNKKSSRMIIGIIGIFIAIFLLAFALLLEGGGATGWMGGHMTDGDTSLSDTQRAIITIAFGVFIFSISYMIYAYFAGKDQTIENASVKKQPADNASPSVESNALPKEIHSDEHQTSRLLEGDERTLYQLVASSGGEILQKDIVAKKIFSKAKVTRLLDKLEEKRVIVRERHGMTNKVKIAK